MLHGMGRLGKSSLAARIANRRRDLRVAVVFEQYGALDILAALAEALRLDPPARDALAKATNEVRQSPDRLEDVLTDLLCGPCAQTQTDPSPVLLVIDDLERILLADPNGGRHRVAPAQALALRAFDAALNRGKSRLVVTSRFPFVLDGLKRRLSELQLPPLTEAVQRKLELRQKEAAADAGLSAAALAEREAASRTGPRNCARQPRAAGPDRAQAGVVRRGGRGSREADARRDGGVAGAGRPPVGCGGA